MAFSHVDRKQALHNIGLTQRQISQVCQTDVTLVSHVLVGRRWLGKDARRIMEYIVNRTSIPIDTFFPWSRRRKGERRRLVA
jgi:hypothetical protein